MTVMIHGPLAYTSHIQEISSRCDLTNSYINYLFIADPANLERLKGLLPILKNITIIDLETFRLNYPLLTSAFNHFDEIFLLLEGEDGAFKVFEGLRSAVDSLPYVHLHLVKADSETLNVEEFTNLVSTSETNETMPF